MGKDNYTLLLLQEKDAFKIFISFILPSLATLYQVTATDLTLIHANSSVYMCIIKIAIKKVCIIEYIINYLKTLL